MTGRTGNDWHDAQVIEATTDRREILFNLTNSETRAHWQSAGGYRFTDSQCLDVRVIVDIDGKVVPPPPITDEMVERAAQAITCARVGGDWSVMTSATLARAALNAALGDES